MVSTRYTYVSSVSGFRERTDYEVWGQAGGWEGGGGVGCGRVRGWVRVGGTGLSCLKRCMAIGFHREIAFLSLIPFLCVCLCVCVCACVCMHVHLRVCAINCLSPLVKVNMLQKSFS